MENTTMGRVLTEATVENHGDLWNVEQGSIPPDQVRRITVSEALVDAGASLLSLPTAMIRQLGLTKVAENRVTSNLGFGTVGVYAAVRLTIGDRFCTTDVTEVPDRAPVLIGQLPLENLDYVIDPRTCRLIGNPAHGGEHMFELYLIRQANFSGPAGRLNSPAPSWSAVARQRFGYVDAWPTVSPPSSAFSAGLCAGCRLGCIPLVPPGIRQAHASRHGARYS
jgi:hypothetical protein